MAVTLHWGLTFAVRAAFFNRPAVIAALSPRVHAALGRAGGYVRKTARNSIRPKPRGVYSQPGHPPFDHYGYAVRSENRARRRMRLPAIKAIGFQGVRSILYAYDGWFGVIVGPISNRRGNATNALEFGGLISVRGANGVRRRVRMAARPFMRPALDQAAQHGILEQFGENAR